MVVATKSSGSLYTEQCDFKGAGFEKIFHLVFFQLYKLYTFTYCEY